MNYGESHTIEMLTKIAKAADKMEGFLSDNAGSSEDCPIKIIADADYARRFANKLTALNRALKPYRKKIK